MTSEDTGIKLLDRPVTEKTDEESEESSDDEPDFLELNDTTKTASKEVQLDKEPSKVLDSDEDEYQFVNQAVYPIAKVKPSKLLIQLVYMIYGRIWLRPKLTSLLDN